MFLLRSFVSMTLLFWLILPLSAKAAGLGSCKSAQDGEYALHIFFPVEKGRLLLKEIKTLRLQKKRVRLLEDKLTIKDETIALWKLQAEAADRAVQKQQVALAAAGKKAARLEVANNRLTLDLARYKGERYKFLMIGLGVGVGVTVAVVVAVVIVGAMKK